MDLSNRNCMNIIVNVLSMEAAEKIPPDFPERLFPERMKKAGDFKKKEDQLRCIGAGALIHDVFKIKEKDLYYNDYGKPMKKGTYFNVSHSGRYIIAVQDREEVGCDIESIRSVRRKTAERMFLPEEQEWVKEKEAETDVRFLTLWTLKESVMKQQGKGFALPPDSFCVLPFLQGKSIRLGQTDLYGVSAEYDRHIISVCAAHPVDQIQIVCISRGVRGRGSLAN